MAVTINYIHRRPAFLEDDGAISTVGRLSRHKIPQVGSGHQFCKSPGGLALPARVSSQPSSPVTRTDTYPGPGAGGSLCNDSALRLPPSMRCPSFRVNNSLCRIAPYSWMRLYFVSMAIRYMVYLHYRHLLKTVAVKHGRQQSPVRGKKRQGIADAAAIGSYRHVSVKGRGELECAHPDF